MRDQNPDGIIAHLRTFLRALQRKFERPDWLAGAPVQIGPVSDRHSLLTGNFTGNFAGLTALPALSELISKRIIEIFWRIPWSENRETSLRTGRYLVPKLMHPHPAAIDPILSVHSQAPSAFK